MHSEREASKSLVTKAAILTPQFNLTVGYRKAEVVSCILIYYNAECEIFTVERGSKRILL